MEFSDMENSIDRILFKLDALQNRLDDIDTLLGNMLDDASKEVWKKAVDMPIGTKVLYNGVIAEVIAYSRYGDEVVVIENMDGVDWVNVNDVKEVKS